MLRVGGASKERGCLCSGVPGERPEAQGGADVRDLDARFATAGRLEPGSEEGREHGSVPRVATVGFPGGLMSWQQRERGQAQIRADALRSALVQARVVPSRRGRLPHPKHVLLGAVASAGGTPGQEQSQDRRRSQPVDRDRRHPPTEPHRSRAGRQLFRPNPFRTPPSLLREKTRSTWISGQPCPRGASGAEKVIFKRVIRHISGNTGTCSAMLNSRAKSSDFWQCWRRRACLPAKSGSAQESDGASN